jgi:hypothetical protein
MTVNVWTYVIRVDKGGAPNFEGPNPHSGPGHPRIDRGQEGTWAARHP